MEPLLVPGKLDSLEKIRKFILLAAENAGLEKARAYKLSLAVDEIATNIINYGHEEAGVEDISVEAEMDEQALTIKLDDTSGFFDPTLKTSPTQENFSQPLGDRAIGGWGVYLAIRSVDQFQYQRLKDHNHNTFVMYRNAHRDG
jgi:anti-sigma regulatory factor (Ser/Thr protein kinase)